MIQININSNFFKLVKYFVFAIIFHLILSWFNGCSSDTSKNNIKKIIVPEETGKFESQKPNSKPLIIEKNITTKIKKDSLIFVENPLNKQLLLENEKLKYDYSKMNDSLKSRTYDKAIELNSFSSRFEDKFMILDINGIVRGEVQEITPSYTRKEFEIELKQKESIFRLLAGAEIGSSIITPKINLKANLMFQNRKGNIISGSYDTNETIWIGYNKSIFNIKR